MMKPIGLRTAIFSVAELSAVKDWYAEFFAKQPYFENEAYVGFEVAGYEFGLFASPSGQSPGPGSATSYWGFDDIDAAWARLIELGATEHEAIADVGAGIRIGAVQDPFGNVFGVIHNPGFKAEA
jgi:predicted enzyme related to lactoylglutathione lyase